MCPLRFAERPDRDEVDTAPPRVEPQQPTLTVGAADDRAEREADRVADEVIGRLQAGGHQHGTGCGHDGIRRSAAAPAGAEVGYDGGALSADLSGRIEGKRGSGSSLPGGVRQRLEQGFGGSLADVRIHTDAESAQLNTAVAARAFTAGKDIFFGAGQYRPDTPEGERVLAHEVAHTRQAGGDARRTPIRRLWDIHQPKIDWTRAVSMTSYKNRVVWFLKDGQGDEVAVKLENQPIGLAQIVGAMHQSMGSARSVEHRKLDDRDKAWLAGHLQNPQVAAGETWAKFAREGVQYAAPGQEEVTDDNAEAAGRKMALHQLRTSKSSLMAMTMAPGKAAEKAALKNFGGTGYDPNVSFFRTKLEQPEHLRQLGRIAAIDLFMGNDDRVTAGNMGNWFYDPSGAVTLIDHVDSASGMASGFVPGVKTWEDNAGRKLMDSQIGSTALSSVSGMASDVRLEGDDESFGDWLKEVVDGKPRKTMIAAGIAAGMREEKKRLIKVFTSTRFTWGGGKARAQKKAFKALSKKAQQDDEGNERFGGGQPQYYESMKIRAAWLKSR